MSRATTGEVTAAEQGVFVVHLSRARKHLQEERYDVARQELDLAALARPADEDVLNLLSVIEFKRGYYNEAARACRALLHNNPISAILHSNLGLILFKAGVLVEAEQELRRALELQPDHVRSHLYLGLLYRMRGKLGLALEHLRYAGAKRVVVEIEEALRRNVREPGARVSAPAVSRSLPSPSALKLAGPLGPARSPATTAPASGLRPKEAEAGDEFPLSRDVPAPGSGRELEERAPAPSGARTPPDGAHESESLPGSPGVEDLAGCPAEDRETTGLAEPDASSPETTDRLEASPVILAPFPEAELPDEPAFLGNDRSSADGLREPFVAEAIEAEIPDEVAGPSDGRPPVPARELTGPLSRESRVAAAAQKSRAAEELSRSEPAIPAAGAGAPSHDEIESRPLFHVRPEGGLEIASRGVVYVRKGSVVWYSGKMRFSSESTFRGTRLEKILRADGRGYLFVNDPGRQAYRRDMNGHALFLEGSRVLALDHGLSFRLEPIHDFRMNRRVDILKIFGRGSVILSVGGALLSHEVTPEFPLNVSSRDLVAWTGELVPSVLEDRFLEEVMMPDIGSAPKIRFEGRGTVMTEPPRPRRRASDLARAPEADRRS
ncbi:MAG: tetratricopeptide repeat protein [Acidobacteriota bacterium]